MARKIVVLLSMLFCIAGFSSLSYGACSLPNSVGTVAAHPADFAPIIATFTPASGCQANLLDFVLTYTPTTTYSATTWFTMYKGTSCSGTIIYTEVVTVAAYATSRLTYPSTLRNFRGDVGQSVTLCTSVNQGFQAISAQFSNL